MEPERDWVTGAILLTLGLGASAGCLWLFHTVIKLWAMQ